MDIEYPEFHASKKIKGRDRNSVGIIVSGADISTFCDCKFEKYYESIIEPAKRLVELIKQNK